MATCDACAADTSAELDRASQLLEAQNYDAAIGVLNDISSNDPTVASETLLLLGRCHQLKKDYPNAIRSYEALLEEYRLIRDLGPSS